MMPAVGTAVVVKEELVSPDSDDESAPEPPEPPVVKPLEPTSPTDEPEGDGSSVNAAVGPFSLRDDPFFPTEAIREELKARTMWRSSSRPTGQRCERASTHITY